MTKLDIFRGIIEDEFLDITQDILKISEEKLRIVLKDKSFIDIRMSQKINNRFDFHWERREINGNIFRYDNFPDVRFKNLKSFPEHFHYKKENKAIEAKFSKSSKQGFKDFMNFARDYLKKHTK